MNQNQLLRILLLFAYDNLISTLPLLLFIKKQRRFWKVNRKNQRHLQVIVTKQKQDQQQQQYDNTTTVIITTKTSAMKQLQPKQYNNHKEMTTTFQPQLLSWKKSHLTK